MNLSCFRWTTCCRFKFINYWYAKQKSFNPTEFMVRNIKGLRHRIAEITGLEYCLQRFLPLIQNTFSNSYNSVFEPSILIRSNTKIHFFHSSVALNIDCKPQICFCDVSVAKLKGKGLKNYYSYFLWYCYFCSLDYRPTNTFLTRKTIIVNPTWNLHIIYSTKLKRNF